MGSQTQCKRASFPCAPQSHCLLQTPLSKKPKIWMATYSPRSSVEVSFWCANVVIPTGACDTSPSWLCQLQTAPWTLRTSHSGATVPLNCQVFTSWSLVLSTWLLNKKLDTSLLHPTSRLPAWQATSPAVFQFPNIVQIIFWTKDPSTCSILLCCAPKCSCWIRNQISCTQTSFSLTAIAQL